MLGGGKICPPPTPRLQRALYMVRIDYIDVVFDLQVSVGTRHSYSNELNRDIACRELAGESWRSPFVDTDTTPQPRRTRAAMKKSLFLFLVV